MEIAEAGFGQEDVHVGRILNNFGLLLNEAGDYEQAYDTFLRAVSIYERQLGSDHLMVAEELANLSHIQDRLGEHDARVRTCQRYLTILEHQLDPLHPNVANALICLGNAYHSTGRSPEAIPLYQQALDVYEQAVGPDHSFVAYPLANLANVYRDTGDYELALPLYQRALAIWEDNHQTQDVAGILEDHARLRLLMDEPSVAEPDLWRALSLRREIHPAGHWRIAATQSVLGESLTAQRRYQDAEAVLLQSQAALDRMPPSRRQRTLERLIALYEAWGKPELAARHRAALGQSRTRDGRTGSR